MDQFIFLFTVTLKFNKNDKAAVSALPTFIDNDFT